MLTLRNRPHYDPGSAAAPESVNPLRKTLLLVSAAAVLALAMAAPAAAESCGQKVIDDWYADGVVNKVYALHCYRDALKLLPDDVQTYSSAPDDINRALVAEIRAFVIWPRRLEGAPLVQPGSGSSTMIVWLRERVSAMARWMSPSASSFAPTRVARTR